MRKLKLSASRVIAADDCRRMYRYRYIDGVKREATAANLIFGSAIDEAVREYLNSLAAGTDPAAPDRRFLELWDRARENERIEYPATRGPDHFRTIGERMMQRLETGWKKTGFTVATDNDGAPLTDRWLSADLGTRDRVGVVYRGKIDVAVYTALAEFAVVDIKTAAVAHSALYTGQSLQLTGYQYLVDENAGELAVPPVEKLGFFDLLKKKDPVLREVLVDRRTDAEIEEFKQKLFWLGEDIQRGRFPRVSRHAYNSPCQMCDFARLCTYGETSGLAFPAAGEHRSAA